MRPKQEFSANSRGSGSERAGSRFRALSGPRVCRLFSREQFDRGWDDPYLPCMSYALPGRCGEVLRLPAAMCAAPSAGTLWHQPGPAARGRPEPVIAAPEPAPRRRSSAPARRPIMQTPSFEVVPQEQARKAALVLAAAHCSRHAAGLALIAIIVADRLDGDGLPPDRSSAPGRNRPRSIPRSASSRAPALCGSTMWPITRSTRTANPCWW